MDGAVLINILQKYDVKKEALADIAGFGKAKIKRYIEGYIPARQYSDTLHDFLNEVEGKLAKIKAYKEIQKLMTVKIIFVPDLISSSFMN